LENRPTKRIHKTNLWKTGQAYETNPRYESLRFGFANPDSRICQPGFVSCYSTKDLSGFVKTGRIFGGHKTNPRFESLRIGLTNPDLRICEVGFVNHETNLFGVRIRDYDTKRIHVFTNLLYDSRILTYLLIQTRVEDMSP
jgi:hypothetical protein